jgi:Ran GTPase-activating protein (RanGAP) involved in mRNA processing and transport
MSNETLEQILSSRFVLIAGACLGALLLLAALGLLYYVEHRAITTAATLEQGAGTVVPIDAAKINPANDGKLVHLTGEATTNGTAADPQLGISSKALRLVREVEIRQWKETKTEAKKKGEKTVTYEYNQVWSRDKPPSSSSFHTPAGHANPTDRPYADAKFNAAEVKLGAFILTPAQLDRIPAEEALAVSDAMLATVPDELKGRAKAAPDGSLFVGTSADAPQVGDVRVRYKVAKPQTVTVVAKQTGDTFAPYTTAAGGEVDLIKPGQLTTQEMFTAAQSSGKALNWILRVVSFVILAVGLFLLLRPLVSTSWGVSPEGRTFNIAVAVFAVIASVPVMLVVIGLRWLSNQPATGGALLGVGVVALIGLFVVARSGQSGLFAGLIGGAKRWSAEERDYFRRIALDPDSAGLRLELAAKLEKKGDPMGEFIRLDQALEAIPEGDERRAALDSRWGELLQEHGREWFQGLRNLRLEPKIIGTFFPSLWMHHGIVDQALIDLPGILPEKAEQLFAAAPGLRVLELYTIRTDQGLGGWKDTSYEPNIPAIARVPHLEQIGALKVWSIGLTIADLEAIASSPYLKNLTDLNASYNSLGPRAGVILAQSATLQRLRVLELGSCDLGDEGTASLAGASNLARLIQLSLQRNGIGPEGTTALGSSAHLKNLQILELADNQLSAAGVQALAGSSYLRELTTLDLSDNSIGSEGAPTLAGSPNFSKLTSLKLNNNQLGGKGARSLAESRHLGRLKVLELDSNEIDDAGAIALAASQVIGQLEELSLANNVIGDAGFKALAAWAGLARLKKLRLGQNKAGWAGIKAVAGSPHLIGLKELDLSNNEIGLAGAQALADSPSLKTLTYLWIREANLTPDAEQLLRQRFGDVVHLT